jgi:hypothetical protein
MPHPAHHAPAAAVLMAGHPGGLPPGEGTVVETDSDETGAGQRSLLVVGQPRIPLSSVVTSAETAPPTASIRNLRTVVRAGVERTVNPSADAFQGSNP